MLLMKYNPSNRIGTQCIHANRSPTAKKEWSFGEVQGSSVILASNQFPEGKW